jgi:hypothetical protein
MNRTKKLRTGFFLALALACIGFGTAHALAPSAPVQFCPEYPGCPFGGSQYACCDPG